MSVNVALKTAISIVPFRLADANDSKVLGELIRQVQPQRLLAAHEIGRAKPDPAVFRAACEALALPPSEVAYVGDDLRLDVEGAQKAGLRGLWLNRYGAAKPAEQSHIEPDATLASLHELEQWLHLRSTND